MEILIVIGLLIVIALLLQDKIAVKKKSEQKPAQEKANPKLPDIMGQPKPKRSLSLPNTATQRKMEEPEINPDNLDIEYDANENAGIQIQQEELGEVFSNRPDLEEEEEEWNRYGISGKNDGFAQGVTFEELSAVGMMLQKENLETSQKETAIAIVQKLQGTDLFSLLENSVEDASRKIAELLDSTLSAEMKTGSSTVRHRNFGDFDIGDFV